MQIGHPENKSALRAAAYICYRSTDAAADRRFADMMADPAADVPLATNLFDTDFYRAQYDPEEALHPVMHYCLKGWTIGLAPHPLFQPWCIERMVPPSGRHLPTLAYYLGAGEDDRLTPHPLFNPAVYLTHGGERRSGETAFENFMAGNTSSEAEFSEFFSVMFYRNQSGIVRFEVNALDHYYRTPLHERRDANPMFHNGYYLLRYPDVAEAGMDPLEHFVVHGHREFREPNPYAIHENYGRATDTARYLLDYVTLGKNSA